MTISDPTDHTVTSTEQLEAIVGLPNQRAATKVRPRLADVHREWIAASPFVVLSTVDSDGRVDASPKGDPVGFVHVLDDRTIAIPERPGNRRVDGYRNILDNPHAGTLFLVPGRGDTLRVNGRARIVADAPYFDAMRVQGRRPILAVEIDVEEVFFHCAKAFMRAHLWEPDTWEPGALPSPAEIAHAISGDDLDELRERYSDDNYRRLLY
ncbi:pyridoxamine 5'-phosphate oxidase family protein [Williamsia sp. SKLECPSW1]